MRGPRLGARAAGARARARLVGLLARVLPDRASRTSTRSPAGWRWGASCTRTCSGLPDIDLDFPRDIRERLIPRVHERYGHDRAALVAAFPTFRARGAIRELGKVLGLPAGEIERVARGADPYGPVRARHRRRAARRAIGRRGRGRPAPLAALALAGAAGRAGLRAAAPPLPAPGRDDRRHQAADRLLPGRARGDGGQADGPVGQGLLRGRGLSEDRPARPGDALGGGALRGGNRARARRAHRPLAHPVRRPAAPSRRSARPTRSASFRSRAARRCSRCCARGRRTSTTSTIQVAIVRPGPIQGGAINPYIERRRRLREDPDVSRSPTSIPRSSRSCARRSARSSSRTR